MTKYQGNTVEEAIANGLSALGLTKEEVDITILQENKKGFLGIGKKMAEVELIVKVNRAEAAQDSPVEITAEEKPAPKEENGQPILTGLQEELEDEEALTQLALYLTAITKGMDAPALVKMQRDSSHFLFQLETTKQGMLIGKHGKVLNALQYLAQIYIHRIAKNKLSVVINVGDYREKRKEILERLADRTAEKVKRTGQPVFLEPMPAFERKQVHAALTANPYVKTHSEGDEPYRYLVVEPEKHGF